MLLISFPALLIKISTCFQLFLMNSVTFSTSEPFEISTEIMEIFLWFIADKGFDAKFGARPLKRAIQKYFEDPLSEEIISAQIKEGDAIKVSLNKDKSALEMKITKPKGKQKKDKLKG